MLADHLRALALLPFRPRRGMSGLLDAGGLIPAFVLAGVASLALYGGLAGLVVGAMPHPNPMARRQPAMGHGAPADHAGAEGASEGRTDAGDELVAHSRWVGLISLFGVGPFASLGALALLYTPVTLLLVTLFDRIGSFGVALRRDFGGLLVCTLSVYTVVALPFGALTLLFAGLARPSAMALLALVLAGVAAFAALMVVAVETACGARRGPALAAVGLSWLTFGLQGFVLFAASPWLLYLGYRAFAGDVSDIVGGLGARRSFRRHLEAATLNPKDSDAHYQLGLLHLQRRQFKEAEARFRLAVEANQDEIDAHFQLARLAREQGRLQEALTRLEAVLARDPRHSSHEAWREAGAVYLATSAFEEARTVLVRFVEYRPYDPEGLCRLGIALRGLGQADQAKEHFMRCVEAARTSPPHRQRDVRPWQREAEKALRG
jgi:hypothetical protein